MTKGRTRRPLLHGWARGSTHLMLQAGQLAMRLLHRLLQLRIDIAGLAAGFQRAVAQFFQFVNALLDLALVLALDVLARLVGALVQLLDRLLQLLRRRLALLAGLIGVVDALFDALRALLYFAGLHGVSFCMRLLWTVRSVERIEHWVARPVPRPGHIVCCMRVVLVSGDVMSESKTEQPWWRGAVVYQIFPDSFSDSNGDGRGDAQGLLQRLEYLQWLGVDALWLSPMYTAPMADGGDDISDHKGVHPHFGTLEDMDRLIAEAHRLGLRVLLDYVPNHTSDEHPWFVESRSSRNNAKRDWYIWRDSTNNWRAGINCKEAWTWDEHTRQHYLHLFLPQQPDLDWRNPAVVDAMHDVLGFWIE